MINMALAKRRNLSKKRIKKINRLQALRDWLYNAMRTCEAEYLPTFSRWVTETEFKLQKAWRFEMDQAHHKFWNLPRCTCPKMDNDDRYPQGNYIYNAKCPVHGSATERLRQ